MPRAQLWDSQGRNTGYIDFPDAPRQYDDDDDDGGVQVSLRTVRIAVALLMVYLFWIGVSIVQTSGPRYERPEYRTTVEETPTPEPPIGG